MNKWLLLTCKSLHDTNTQSKPRKVPTSLISLKCHFSVQSSRIIWTVVSKNNEYWIHSRIELLFVQ